MLYRHQEQEFETALFVQAGEIAVSNEDKLLVSSPLGSCIAVVIFDKETKTGGLAHTMLPGKAPDNYRPEDKNKYCYDAIENLLKVLDDFGISPGNQEICLAGGANVLKKPHDTIARAMVNSVLRFVVEKKLPLVAAVLGGTERRTISLDTKTGIVSYTCGDDAPKILWKYL
jgi:chemotaxis protein CheD